MLWTATPVRAQINATLDAIGTRVEFGGGGRSSVVSLAPSLRWNARRASVLAQGSWARFGEGTWSGQGVVEGSIYGLSMLGLRSEFGAIMGGTLQEDGPGTSQLSGVARLHYGGTRLGGWAGGTLGRAYDGTSGRTIVAGEVGAWGRFDAVTLAATAVPTGIGDSFRHTDVVGTLRVERGSLDAMVFGGWRLWSRPSATPDATWVGAHAAIWLSRHLAVVAGGGTYPIDWAQGLPSGRFATLGLRMATHRQTERHDVGARVLPPGITPIVPAFEAVHRGNSRWTLRIRAPKAARVEVMGDFTLWEPVALEAGADGRWSSTFTLTRGVYRMNVRVNGGPWGVPPGVLVLHDEFNGAVGVLTIDR